MRWRRSVNQDRRLPLCSAGGEARERVLARARSDKSLTRFDRIALVLSGGGALGAYQAGAYAGLEQCGVRPNWLAGTAIGAINAAIIAGSLPHERVARLRHFWQELSRCAVSHRNSALTRRTRAALVRWTGWSRQVPAELEGAIVP